MSTKGMYVVLFIVVIVLMIIISTGPSKIAAIEENLNVKPNFPQVGQLVCTKLAQEMVQVIRVSNSHAEVRIFNANARTDNREDKYSIRWFQSFELEECK